MGVMPDVVAAVRAARDRMEALGATIVPVELPDLETTATTFTDVFDVEMRAAHAGLYPERAADYGPLTRHALAHFATRDPLVHVEGAIDARAFRQRIDQLFDDVDVLLCPVARSPHRRRSTTRHHRDLRRRPSQHHPPDAPHQLLGPGRDAGDLAAVGLRRRRAAARRPARDPRRDGRSTPLARRAARSGGAGSRPARRVGLSERGPPASVLLDRVRRRHLGEWASMVGPRTATRSVQSGARAWIPSPVSGVPVLDEFAVGCHGDSASCRGGSPPSSNSSGPLMGTRSSSDGGG